MKTIEITQVDLRYESFRLKDKQRERSLLPSIQEQGILEPLQGVVLSGVLILLDGFKRYRVAKQLQIRQLPYITLAVDEASAMIQLIRIANSKHLHILEQAGLVDELRNKHGLSVVEIAKRLERSTGWVSMRLGVLGDIPEVIKLEIFNGRFPAYNYLYTLRHFIRMKQASKSEVEEFVRVVAGKQLSSRNIDLLARGYFQGSSELRQQILKGEITWSLDQLKASIKAQEAPEAILNEFENRFIKDLQIIQKYLSRVNRTLTDSRITSTVYAEGNLIAGGILRQLEAFSPSLKRFYDQSR